MQDEAGWQPHMYEKLNNTEWVPKSWYAIYYKLLNTDPSLFLSWHNWRNCMQVNFTFWAPTLKQAKKE
jgi:hypothetical protein